MLSKNNLKLAVCCSFLLLYLLSSIPIHAMQDSVLPVRKQGARILLSPRININKSKVRSELIELISFAKEETLFNQYTPLLYWKLKIRNFLKKSTYKGNPYKLVKKIIKTYNIKFEERGKKISSIKLTSKEINSIFSEILLNNLITKQKLEAILKLGQKLNHDPEALVFDVQLCDAWSPGPSQFRTYDSSDVLLHAIYFAGNLSDADFFSSIRFLETVVEKKYEMFYAMRMAKKITEQIASQSASPFQSYASQMLKVLRTMQKERYNRSFDFDEIVAVIIKAVDSKKNVYVGISEQSPSTDSSEPVEINFMMHALFFSRGIFVKEITPDDLLQSAI